MVILTCRTLHFSRVQSCATVVTRPETTSSSHRRPRAIAATRRARRSNRSGRILLRDALCGSSIRRDLLDGGFCQGIVSDCSSGESSSAFIRYFLGLRIDAPYSLDDMRNDTVGLMDALEIEKAHVVGASMGGMIAQLVASRNGERVKSLVSIMSSSGDPRLPTGKPKAVATLTASRPPKDDRESCVRFEMSIRRAIESPGYPASETHLRAEVERTYDRNNYRAGMARQLMAVLSSGSRVELLRTIRVPALVLHGVDDPLVPVEAGEDTARHIPGAVLKTFPGWGHDMPAALIPVLAAEIAGHCRAAEIA